MRARKNQKLTVAQFLKVWEGSEDKVELIDGEVWLMAGGSQRHNDIAVNIVGVLLAKLRGTGCRPYSSDMGLRIDFQNLRYPDVMVACDPRDLDQDREAAQALHHPAAVFEVLSPGTAGDDSRFKAEQYRALPSLRLIALVDPAGETIRGFARPEPGGRWEEFILDRGASLVLPEPPVTLTAEEIFAR